MVNKSKTFSVKHVQFYRIRSFFFIFSSILKYLKCVKNFLCTSQSTISTASFCAWFCPFLYALQFCLPDGPWPNIKVHGNETAASGATEAKKPTGWEPAHWMKLTQVRLVLRHVLLHLG